jgi:hypothetical protein
VFYGFWICARLLQFRRSSEKILNQVDKLLKARRVLVTNLAEQPEKYHLNPETKQKLQETCQQAELAKGFHEQSSYEHLLGVMVESLCAENAFKENENWKEFQKNFEAVKSEIESSKRQYNEFARMFHARAEHFPANLIARIIGLKEIAFLNLP